MVEERGGGKQLGMVQCCTACGSRQDLSRRSGFPITCIMRSRCALLSTTAPPLPVAIGAAPLAAAGLPRQGLTPAGPGEPPVLGERVAPQPNSVSST